MPEKTDELRAEIARLVRENEDLKSGIQAAGQVHDVAQRRVDASGRGRTDAFHYRMRFSTH